jgi:hypothetical protein
MNRRRRTGGKYSRKNQNYFGNIRKLLRLLTVLLTVPLLYSKHRWGRLAPETPIVFAICAIHFTQFMQIDQK